MYRSGINFFRLGGVRRRYSTPVNADPLGRKPSIVQIRCSPPSSLNIKSSVSELAEQRAAVLKLASGASSSLEFTIDTNVDPHTCHACLGARRISSSSGPTRLVVAADGSVVVSGSPSDLETFAMFLECDAGLLPDVPKTPLETPIF